ncbi:MAG: hypothetical protein GXO75_03785 [Calditrichaeota bacterium]|nr:hypothetical protein [Calditrichota bacterium]
MRNRLILLAFTFLGIPFILQAQTIRNTPHNLSISGQGITTASSASEMDMCSACHTPHRAVPQTPLWKQSATGTTYKTYNSSTTQAVIGQPTGSSLLCLSCHDGTIALQTNSIFSPHINFSGKNMQSIQGSSLSHDLSDDHPISFTYDASLAYADNELVLPSSLPKEIKLENEQLQCTTCHDPHNNMNGDFLTITNRYSELCITCHEKQYWNSSSHNNSSARWNGVGTYPWSHTPYQSVSENGCENCHEPHGAGGQERLLNYSSEEDNCLYCHDGNVASTDIQIQINKPYSHNVYKYIGLHNPEEQALLYTSHVECVDCHNPHASTNANASAPIANGFIRGVKGIEANGNGTTTIQFEYELCYRCHADSPNKPASPTSRQIDQDNVRLEFDLNNPSYHPVEGPGKNSDVPSLISPYSESSIIYCTDCHASNGASSPAGPHGSIYPHILKYRYQTDDNTPESFQNYELCYQCHERNSIINAMGMFGRKVHKKHIVRENASCNICHDPHGISSSQGNTTNNSHLINFDLSVVSPDPRTSKLEYVSLGHRGGECYLSCHGENHSPKRYR